MKVSVSELPKIEALGIELRQTSGYAAPVNVKTGELTRDSRRFEAVSKGLEGVFGGGESNNGLEKPEMMVVSSGLGWNWLLYYIIIN